jgi:hypothetical protein
VTCSSREGGHETRLFLVLGRLFKLHPAFDDMILGVLAAHPRAVVALIQERQEPWTTETWKRLSRAAGEGSAKASAYANATGGEGQVQGAALRGVGVSKGAAAIERKAGVGFMLLRRVRFVHHWNYQRVLALPQLVAVLDTYPYGGCLTTLEALAHGRPVLTRPSRFVRGRFSLAMYRQMGLLQDNITTGATPGPDPTGRAVQRSLGFGDDAYGGIYRGAYGDQGDGSSRRQHQRGTSRTSTRKGPAAAAASGGGGEQAPPTELGPGGLGLVASSAGEFVAFAAALARDRRHQAKATAAVRRAASTNDNPTAGGGAPGRLHRNEAAAAEWAAFLWRAAGRVWPPRHGVLLM